MKHVPVFLVSTLVAATLLAMGCAQSAPASAPTQAAAKAAEPAKAAAPAAPTTAPAAQPTAASASPKAEWPQKGRSINFLVPFAAGGGTDVASRILAPMWEKELGVPIQIVNKPGANTQVANAEVAKAKPDGYTLGLADIVSVILSYQFPERGAPYTRKDFDVPAGLFHWQAVWAVKSDSPYKSVKDVVDAAKAKPDSIKAGDTGLQGPWHLANIAVQQAANIKLGLVHFDGGAPTTTALMGGHIDIACTSTASANAMVKGGGTRLIGVMADQRSPFYPDVPTFKEQGYNVVADATFGIFGPAGLPKEAFDTLTAVGMKAAASAEFKEKAFQNSIEPWVKSPAEVDAYWAEEEKFLQPLVKAAMAEK